MRQHSCMSVLLNDVNATVSTLDFILFSGPLQYGLDCSTVLCFYNRQKPPCACFIIHVVEEGITSNSKMSFRKDLNCSQWIWQKCKQSAKFTLKLC